MSTASELLALKKAKSGTKASTVSVISDKTKNEVLAVAFAEQLATNGAFVFFARLEVDKKGKPKLDKESNEYYTCFFCQSRNVRGDNADPNGDESLNEDALGWKVRNRIVRSLQRVLKANYEADALKDNPMFQTGVVQTAEFEVNGETVMLPSVYIKVTHQTTPSYDEQSARQVPRDGVDCYITNEAGEPTYEVTTPLKAKYSPTGELKATDKLIPSADQRFIPIEEDEDEEEEEDDDELDA